MLEVVNGITFLTPLWLRKPRVTLVHHIHRDHYVTELGPQGAVAALLAETLPLKLLYARRAVPDHLASRPRRDIVDARRPAGATSTSATSASVPFESDRRASAPRRRGCSTSGG